VSDQLRITLRRTLAEDADLSVSDLLARIRRAGAAGLSRAGLERALAADPACVEVEVAGRRRWRLDAAAVTEGERSSAGTTLASGEGGLQVDRAASRAGLDALALRPWQAEALAAWSATTRGVVEAVTGAGKTRLALAAVRLVVERGGGVLVLVPSLGLQDQWVRELAAVVPRQRIGRLGGGRADDLGEHAVVVATPQSAAGLPLCPPDGVPGLLIADEAHRLGAPTWAEALKPDFTLRLALTATFERGDDGLAEILEPYFGGVVHRYGYAEAARDGTIAPFDITLLGVPLTGAERERHDLLDARVRRLTGSFAAAGSLPRDPRALIAALAAVVADAERSGRDGPQVRAAREYLAAVRERRAVAAGAARKPEVVAALAPALGERRTLAFTDTVEQAEQVVALLRRGGVPAAVLHGGLDDRSRRSRLARFGRGELRALAAPRVLDEGVDLPDADVALALSAFRSRRHLIQRLGRVLRVKPDGRGADLVLLHAAGTLEDPARGGHHGFLAQVEGAARRRDDLALTGDDDSDARVLAGLADRLGRGGIPDPGAARS
jgi:superfamily II DNA or RNA helicase